MLAGERIDLLFDARHIRQSGIGTYISTLLPHLEETFAQREMSLAVLAADHAVPALRADTTVVVERAAGPMYSLAEQRVWSRSLRTVRPRALWVPHYPFPLAALGLNNRKTMVFSTVHDTGHCMRQQVSGQSRARQLYARAMLAMDLRKCRRIFTPSQATATLLLRMVPSAPVTVTPIPVDEEWLEPADPKMSPVSGPYLLYVGNTKWHKNLPLLLQAFAEVACDVPHRLVIAGSGELNRAGDDRVRSLAAKQGDRVQVMGRLDFDALRALVASADLLVMPSLYEGAGLPPIEAMASRTAVFCSDIAALRETCGEGAEYFDPYNHHSLAALLRTYLCDGAARAELAERGWSHVVTRQSGISFDSAPLAVATDLAGCSP